MKNILKKIFNIFGLEIHKLSLPALSDEGKLKWLQSFKVNTILDIGANRGQFALMIRKYFADAIIYSFEPLKDVCEELSENLSKKDRNKSSWRAFNTALGDFNGVSKIKRSENTTDTSMLKMTEFYKGTYNCTKNPWEEEISIRKLDDFIKEEKLEIVPELMIKMDVEGYEEKVIKGGDETFKKAKIIFTEVTFQQERYEGQILFDDLHEILKGKGYRCYGFFQMSFDHRTGAPLYADAIFVRDSG